MRALGISLALHVAFFGALELRQELIRARLLPSWLNSQSSADRAKTETDKALKERDSEVPLVFVEVDPAVATPQAPKDAQYYSSLNSQAANPDATLDTATPRLDGTQDKIAKTFDTLRPEPAPAQPAPQPAAPPPTEVATREPNEPSQPAGSSEVVADLAFAKPQTRLLPVTAQGSLARPPENPRPRPQTLAEARRQKGLLTGEQMKQDGGVKRRGVASLDVKQTPFGAYDYALVAAVQNRWDDLLERFGFAGDRQGKVVLTFRLHPDGRVTDMAQVESEVGDLLAYYCQRAVLDNSPYAPWPLDMRRMVGNGYRGLRFTFYY